MDLNTVWFLLVGVLMTGYAILDGFDLGVGVLSLFAKDNTERRLLINAIAPVWDGNEVWLLTGGGALFAAFPLVYATVFSSFYLAMMLLLTALIFRAVSMEFRGKVDSPGWRRAWDMGFGLGSILPAVLLGVAYGNILRGIPLDGTGTSRGSFLDLLNPYALLVGLLSLVTFTMHGALYLAQKTDGQISERMKRWAFLGWVGFAILCVLTAIATAFVSPFLFEGLASSVLFWIFSLVLVGSAFLVPYALRRKRTGLSFVASSGAIAALVGLSALGLFPRLVPSTTDLSYSLTIYNASSSQHTLGVMLVIALIGMPLVVLYTIFIYRAFRGKVVIGPDSY